MTWIGALAKSIESDEVMMRVAFTDGRILRVPLAWFPALRDATPEQRVDDGAFEHVVREIEKERER